MVTPSGDRVYRVGEGRFAPKTTPEPIRFTRKSKERSKDHGTVAPLLIVNSQGMPEQIKVQRSLDVCLDANAIEAVRQIDLLSCIMDGNPRAVMIKVEAHS